MNHPDESASRTLDEGWTSTQNALSSVDLCGGVGPLEDHCIRRRLEPQRDQCALCVGTSHEWRGFLTYLEMILVPMKLVGE